MVSVTPTPKTDDMGFSGKRAADIVGITYRQLDYWARTDLIRPSLADARGSGSRRMYSYRNLLELKVVKSLLDAGIRLESVREAFEYLRENLGEDISAARLVIDGTSCVLVRDDAELIDVVNRGQGVLNMLPLDGVLREVDAAIYELPLDVDVAAAADASTPPRRSGGRRVSGG
jgi:DNA-binding transcriptional MerR regulator